MKALIDSHFFPIWCQNFEGQLRKIHEEFVDEDGNTFHDLPFTDFCILVYTERPELIDTSQTGLRNYRQSCSLNYPVKNNSGANNQSTTVTNQ